MRVKLSCSIAASVVSASCVALEESNQLHYSSIAAVERQWLSVLSSYVEALSGHKTARGRVTHHRSIDEW